jgi:glycerol-1-phosphate dehydrogenase [NAD(P)+]
MENLTVDGEPAAHGACVGVGCVAMLALYEWLVAQPLAADDIARAIASPPDAAALARELAAAFGGSPVEANAIEEMRAKRAGSDRVARLRRLAERWPALRDRLGALPNAAEMQWRLRATGGVGHPVELGIPLAKLKTDHRRARLIRRRYTVLDVVEDLGWLDRATDALFGPGGFWAEATNECATRGVPAGQVNESSTLR